MTGRIAFVPPRFGTQVLGGAETVCREVAEGLVTRGWEVDALTTCAIDHFGWGNELPEGITQENGVTVHRFGVVHDRTRAATRAQRSIEAGVIPSLEDQLSWVNFNFQVPGLFHELLRHGDRYDAIVFAPYMFWTSTVCMPIVPERAVVMPCLHDETYARLDVMRPVLAAPRSVWFLSEPEHQLAHRLGPVAARHQVVGSGLDIPEAYDPEGFRRRHGISRPFLLYAGRRELDKGWPALLEIFERSLTLDDHGVDLVTIGVGDADVPASLEGRVIDLGFLSATERDNAAAAALAYAQPSRMESFSRSIMEAWLAGTPVLTIAQSEVVGYHCERSGGGVTFSDEFDLAEILRWLAGAPDEAAAMAERGRRYVLDNYRWSAVLDRMEADLEARAMNRKLAPVLGDVLVVGTYPPIPGHAAAVTLAAVRRAYDAGQQVVVASPRHSAAHRTIRLDGPEAEDRLDQARQEHRTRFLVLCAEPGMPIPLPAPRHGPLGAADGLLRPSAEDRQAATITALARAMDRFDHVTWVVSGGLGVAGELLSDLWNHVDEVLFAGESGGDRVAIAAELGLAPKRLLDVAVAAGHPVGTDPQEGGVAHPEVGILHRALGARVAAQSEAGRPPGVSLFGPPEVLLRERPRQVISVAARRALGPAAPLVRRGVVTVVRAARRRSR